MGESIKVQVRWIHKMADIPQSDWDALAEPLKTPFLEWQWLNNMETSGSATPRTGWQPHHLTLWHHKQLIAAAPLYIKGHSYGEFVFDHQWADLSYRLGLAYYPKLLGMSPFTPAEGYRFLIAPGFDEAEITATMINAIDHFCTRQNLGGCHFLFVDPQWRTLMESFGFTSWLHHSYIWQNQGFKSFDDYLNVFNSNQRRNIKRERKAIEQAQLKLQILTGENIPHNFFPLIYKFYSSTCDKFWGGSKYLTPKFFQQLYPNYSHRVMLAAAYSEGQANPVGMSFFVRKAEQLYGRYWGCFDEFDCLHFEACYYKPIEWAIADGIQMFDPGAGGKHKRRRGFMAAGNHSLHRFYDLRMTRILRQYIPEVNAMEQEEIDAINQDLPFSKREIDLVYDD